MKLYKTEKGLYLSDNISDDLGIKTFQPFDKENDFKIIKDNKQIIVFSVKDINNSTKEYFIRKHDNLIGAYNKGNDFYSYTLAFSNRGVTEYFINNIIK